MRAVLVYKTENGYISLVNSSLEVIDHYCNSKALDEETLRSKFRNIIGDIPGEFKILVNPLDINAREMQNHKEITKFDNVKELDVRYDCVSEADLKFRIRHMLTNSDTLVGTLYNRYHDNLSTKRRLLYANGVYTKNKDIQKKVIEDYLDEIFEGDFSYLLIRELEFYCRYVYSNELRGKQFMRKIREGRR